MRELRIEMTFVHEGEVNTGDLIKKVRDLYSDIDFGDLSHSQDCKCSFNVTDEVYEDSSSYKILCPLCKGIIGGSIFVKED